MDEWREFARIEQVEARDRWPTAPGEEKRFGSFKVEAAGAVDAPLVVVAETFGDVVGDPSPHLAGVALHPRVGGQRLQQRLKRRRVGGHDEAKSAACRLLRFLADAQRSSIRP